MHNDELRARYNELLSEYEQVRKNVTALREKLACLSVTVESTDGMVKVGLGPRGELRSLELDPHAYHRLTPTELAKAILATVEQAGAKLSEQAAKAYAPYLPAGTSYEQLISPEADLSALIPEQPITDETFDDWWAPLRRLAEGR